MAGVDPNGLAGQCGGGRARVSRSAGGRASARGGSRCRRGGRRCRGGGRRRAQRVAGAASRQGRAYAAHDQQAGREAAPASQVPVLTSHRLFPSGARGKSLRDGVARTLWRRSLPPDATLPGPGTGLAARSMGGSSPSVTAPASAVCLPGPAGRTRSLPLPQAPVGDHGRAGGGCAISITRYGDEAYDLRDIRGPGLIRLESGRRLGWPQFLGRACCAQNAIRTTRRSVNSGACAAFRSRCPGPGHRGQPGIPRRW
jgi:hypothetical protein